MGRCGGGLDPALRVGAGQAADENMPATRGFSRTLTP